MVQAYKVRKGDTLTSISKQFQHRKWETIWEAPENKALVSKRKKPDAIQAGDQLTIPPNEKQQELAKNARTLTIKGKRYVLQEKEFATFIKDVLPTLKKAVVAVEIRVVLAKSYWKTFSELNNDQKIVSWFVDIWAKLPPEGLIQEAEAAHQRLEAAVEGGDFNKIAKELKAAVIPVNKAYTTIFRYKEGVIKGAEKELALLEFTSDIAFEIVTGIGKVEMGGTPGSDAAVGALSGVVKSAAGEFGKYLAGTSGGGASAAKSIVLDGALGAASEAVGALIKLKGKKVVEGVAEAAAKKISGKWAARLGPRRVEEFLAKRLCGAMKGGLEEALKGVLKAAKGETTPAQFFERVAKEMGLGGTLDGLEPFIDKKFAPAVLEKMIKKGFKLSDGMSRKTVEEIISTLTKERLSSGVEKAVKTAVEAARGGESAEDLGENAADDFALSNFDKLEEEVIKQFEKR